MKRLLLALATLFASACCSSLPRLPAKRVALPELHPRDMVVESTEELRDEARGRDVPIRIYKPATANAPMPVVLFSHGIGEDRDSYAWIGRALAQHGYMSVHVTHAGTDRAVLERGYLHLYRSLKVVANWIARPHDFSFVLDHLSKRDDVDLKRVAAAGHSAGAYTTFGIAGLRDAQGVSLHDDRIALGVAMSMPRIDAMPENAYDFLRFPILSITGTCDSSLIYRTFPRHRRIPFERTHAREQYLATIKGATHDSFVIEDTHRDAVLRLTIAFLDAHFRDDASARMYFAEEGVDQAISVERKNAAAR